jgi:hypothetical protein
MVDGQVVERPRVSHMFFKTQNFVLVVKSGDRAGPIRGISGTLRREERGECCGYSEVFYMVAPTCVD